jgi:AraC-like DNA-binding protein
MKNVYSTALTPQPNASVSINTVYYVRADRSYDVHRANREPMGYELFRTIAGRGRLEFDDAPPVEVSGDTLIITPRKSLNRYVCIDDEWTFWWFGFQASEPLAFDLQTSLGVDGALSDDVHGNQCLTLLREDTPQSSAHASAVLSFLLGKWAWQLNRSASRLNPHSDGISRVIEMMHTRLGEKLSVSTMAKAACLSERRFRQVFESIAGAPPKKYFDRLRLETAAQMLVTTSLSIAELAETLGYSSQFHFSRAFKSHFGDSPTRYRG